MILVVGALHLDVVVDAPRLPRLDETLMGSGVTYRLGGKGGNQAVAAARLGAPVAMAGRVGTDGFADTLLETLAEAGVETALIERVSGASGMSAAIVTETGDYGAVVVSGANLEMAAPEIPVGTGLILLQNEVSEAVNLVVAERAGDIPIILNAAPAREMAPELLARVETLVVNQLEGADLTGETAPEQMLAPIAEMGPARVVVTLGAEGLICREPDGSVFALGAPKVDVRTTHGAGDVFLGAYAAERLTGADNRHALETAQSAAALHVARGSAPTQAELATFHRPK